MGVALGGSRCSKEHRFPQVGVKACVTRDEINKLTKRSCGTWLHAGGTGVEESVELLREFGDGGLVSEFDGHREGQRREVPNVKSKIQRKRREAVRRSGPHWKP
jgi:hypothetical protein